jgi:hypothetical protein
VNVTRTRGEIVGKASFAFKWDGSGSGSVSGNAPVIIKFGGGSSSGGSSSGTTIFSGFAKRIMTTPTGECANEVIIRVQAEDIMHKIINKRINRRQKQQGLGPIAFITSIHKRPDIGFDDPNMLYALSGGSSPMELDAPTMLEFRLRQLLNGEQNSYSWLHTVQKLADHTMISTPGGAGGGMGLHDHSTLDLNGPHAGGPAKAVYGVK